MELKLDLLKAYYNALYIESEYISPNLVANTVNDLFPYWNLTSEQVVWLSDRL